LPVADRFAATHLCLPLWHGLIDGDADRVIDAGRTAVDTAPPHTPCRSAFLGNLGGALLARFRQTGGQADVAASLDALRRAALAAATASPERATVLANLCGALQIVGAVVAVQLPDPERLPRVRRRARFRDRPAGVQSRENAENLGNLASAPEPGVPQIVERRRQPHCRPDRGCPRQSFTHRRLIEDRQPQARHVRSACGAEGFAVTAGTIR
jgi:hypothetical protein